MKKTLSILFLLITSKFCISDCPIVGQQLLTTAIVKIWHDCNNDGVADRICYYKFKESGVETLRCDGEENKKETPENKEKENGFTPL